MIAQVNNNLLPKLYTVAIQRKEGEEVNVYKVRETNESELYPFLKRFLSITSLQELSFFEVHRQLPAGKGVQIIFGDSRKAWPKGVATNHHQVIVARNHKVMEDVPEQGSLLPTFEEIERQTKESKVEALVTALIDNEKILNNLEVKELRDKEVAFVKPLRIKEA